MRIRALKETLLGLTLLLTITSLFSQSVYYGYPPAQAKTKKGDIILLNVPEYLHAKFNWSEQISQLVDFINTNSDKHLNIEVHIFLDSTEYDIKLAKHLMDSLIEILTSKCKNGNYVVTANGRNSPIYLNKESPLFRKMNTRLEILIE